MLYSNFENFWGVDPLDYQLSNTITFFHCDRAIELVITLRTDKQIPWKSLSERLKSKTKTMPR